MLTIANIQDRRGSLDRRGGGQWIDALTAAIEQGQVEILFQPQFATRGNGLIGAEALSRWNHPRLGCIGPETLFDIAERCGQATRLTRHIAGRALAIARGWPESLKLSLNVTPADLADQDFADALVVAMAENGFAAERLTLEITEQALVAQLDTSAERLAQLADRGIRIALDDFGAGFCNFRYLKHLPLDGLKLDRSMVEGIAHDERDVSVLRGIVTMAKALGLWVIAEGVETEEQRLAIAREGCEKWQGFLGGAPMTAEEFAEFSAG